MITDHTTETMNEIIQWFPKGAVPPPRGRWEEFGGRWDNFGGRFEFVLSRNAFPGNTKSHKNSFRQEKNQNFLNFGGRGALEYGRFQKGGAEQVELGKHCSSRTAPLIERHSGGRVEN